MAVYIVKVSNYEFGVKEAEERISAGNAGTAAARGWRKWKATVASKKRMKSWVIKITRV